jgi:hypothetical protein
VSSLAGSRPLGIVLDGAALSTLGAVVLDGAALAIVPWHGAALGVLATLGAVVLDGAALGARNGSRRTVCHYADRHSHFVGASGGG